MGWGRGGGRASRSSPRQSILVLSVLELMWKQGGTPVGEQERSCSLLPPSLSYTVRACVCIGLVH